MGENKENLEVTIEQTGQTFNLPTGELVASVRDALLNKRRLDIASVMWKSMTEDQQKKEVEDWTSFAYDLVAGIVNKVASADCEVIHASFNGASLKPDGSIEVKLSGRADDEALVGLNHMRGKLLKVMVIDEDQFDQHREPYHVDKDEPALFEDEPDTPPSDDKEIIDLETGEITEAGQDDDRTDEWLGGFNSRIGLVKQSECPFEEDDAKRMDWLDGWAAAHDDPEAPDLPSDGPNEVVDALEGNEET